MSQGQQRSYPQKKVNRGNGGNNNNSDSHPVCAQCGKKHAGVCRSGSNACYICGKEGHYARNCTLSNQNLNPQFKNRNPSRQLHMAQVKIEGPSLAQGRLEAPESQARIYAYTQGDVEAGTSSVVTVLCNNRRSGLVYGLSWKWTAHPNHFIATRHGKQPSGNLWQDGRAWHCKL
ncbi:hypothetical protein TIFTF001_014290 [Ficus carica]|uniref:CCHC-type domain-containing protein n=1 Tax=Ficus carica TaxID=3494 RepID=A0AA88AJE5_FICCA|nr:hypothetical protein TIFTF001_014290 [Ficus carica]